MIKAIIFDLDNTLVDFMKMKWEAVKAAVDAMVDAGLDMNSQDAYDAIKSIYNLEGIEFQKVFDRFLTQHYGAINHKVLAAGLVAYRKSKEVLLVLYPHVTATLVTLGKRGIKLAILTDAPVKQAWLRLCYLNLHHIFDAVITPEDTGTYKPSPRAFHLALNRLNVDASEALMVGDWPERDMVGAGNVGITTVFARYGNPQGIVDAGADYNIDDISELLKIIDEQAVTSGEATAEC